jgi:nucleotide-binding universal stress UspA family protein
VLVRSGAHGSGRESRDSLPPDGYVTVGAREADRAERRSDAVKTILVGYDGTRAAERALDRAGELATAFQAKILVVSVVPPDPLPSTGAFGLMPYAEPAPVSMPTANANEAVWQQHRERVQALFAGLDVPVEFVGVIGTPVEEIVQLAARQDADLIVVGTREPGFLERLFRGSVSEGVARHARCDVLVVHPDDEE